MKAGKRIALTILFLLSVGGWGGGRCEPPQHDVVDHDAAHATEEEEEEPKKVEKVFSFGKYEPALRDICREMELDGRRAHLFSFVEARSKEPNECASCRALLRSVVSACRRVTFDAEESAGKKGKKKTPKGKGKEQEGGGDQEKPTPPTPTPLPVPQRLPSTVLLDATSRLSARLYEQDPAGGAIYQALRQLVDLIISKEDECTVAEKDYYRTFCEYLMSAWQGRESKEQVKKRHHRDRANDHELFE